MLTILVVDDSLEDRRHAGEILREHIANASVREIAGPEEFSAALAGGVVDVIVTDCRLRWSDGLQLVRRARERFPEIPVVMFTASGDEETAVDAMKQGVDDYLVKTPGRFLRLPLAVRAAVARRQLTAERHRSERAWRDSEVRFRLLVEGVRDYALFMLDAEGHVASWNPGAERIFGYSTDEITGQAAARLYPAEDRQARVLERELDEARRQGRASDSRWLLRKDGSPFWAEGVTTVLRDDGGDVATFAKVVRDATQRKRADEERAEMIARERRLRAQAETANRTKDDFLATVSHELRTPLNAILGWTRLLRTRALDAGTVRRALETIERNADAQRQLVEDLLDVSRIISGRLRLDIREVNLEDAIRGAVDTVLPAARAKGIRVETEVDPAAGHVAGDPSRLQQVVWNLLSNAVKFTPVGGRVAVGVEARSRAVALRVSDTGPGVPDEFLGRIFDRFTQAETTTTRSHKGLGLGLAIVRHIVELHGGTVEVENSPRPGWGAVFTVSLPRTAVPPAAQHAPSAVDERERDLAQTPALTGVRVLVVEDDDDSRELIRSVLETCGAEVTASPGVDDAIGHLDQQPFDVVVSDIAMPGRDGYDLIRALRARPPDRGGQTPAVALTARARFGDRLRALSSGFQLHVPKPVEPAELCVVVASLSGRSRAA